MYLTQFLTTSAGNTFSYVIIKVVTFVLFKPNMARGFLVVNKPIRSIAQLFYGHVRKPGIKVIKIEIDNVFFES
jgi:hypothetical protein